MLIECPGFGFVDAQLSHQRADTTLGLLSGDDKVLRGTRSKIEIRLTLAPKRREQAKAWVGFMMMAADLGNSFLLPLPCDNCVSSHLLVNPSVNGANQVGKNLLVSGLPPSQTVFSVGDFISVQNRLNMVTADVTSDETGQAQLPLLRPMQQVFDDGATVEAMRPMGEFRMKEPVTSVSIDRLKNAGISFIVVEV